jgi:hypothetical protein
MALPSLPLLWSGQQGCSSRAASAVGVSPHIGGARGAPCGQPA